MFLLCAAAAEQEKLAAEITAVMESLTALDGEASSVMQQQERLTEEQAGLAAALEEVKGRREIKQKEVCTAHILQHHSACPPQL